MIHKIKAMYDEGRGSSVRAIAVALKISRNTVRKYLAMSAEEIAAYQAEQRRTRRLDVHRTYIVHLLETDPRLSAVKVLRKLREAHGDLAVSARSARRDIRELKETVTLKQERDDEPVAHLVDRDELDEAGDDGAGLRVAEVHGLDVEPVGCSRKVGSFWERDKVC